MMNTFHRHNPDFYNDSSSDECSATTMGDEESVDLLRNQSSTSVVVPETVPGTSIVTNDTSIEQSTNSNQTQVSSSKPQNLQSIISITNQEKPEVPIPSSLITNSPTSSLKSSLVVPSSHDPLQKDSSISQVIPSSCPSPPLTKQIDKDQDNVLSPATRTLNELSQIEPADGSDLIYDMSQHKSRKRKEPPSDIESSKEKPRNKLTRSLSLSVKVSTFFVEGGLCFIPLQTINFLFVMVRCIVVWFGLTVLYWKKNLYWML